MLITIIPVRCSPIGACIPAWNQDDNHDKDKDNDNDKDVDDDDFDDNYDCDDNDNSDDVDDEQQKEVIFSLFPFCWL